MKHSAVHKQGAGVQPLQEGGFRGSPLESTLTQLSFRSESSSCSRVQIAIIMETIVFFFCIFTSFFYGKMNVFLKKKKSEGSPCIHQKSVEQIWCLSKHLSAKQFGSTMSNREVKIDLCTFLKHSGLNECFNLSR